LITLSPRAMKLKGGSCFIIGLNMPQPATGILIALQCFVVAFVGLHNWIPLGSLNDLNAVRSQFPGSKLFLTTLSNFIPAAFGLACSVYFYRGFPGWVTWYLSIFYLLACGGSAYAWWIPYFLGAGKKRLEREQELYGKTHSFLPARYGVRPNTLHVIFDVVTLAIVITLAVIGAQRR
jgi:hypothetical protein